MSAGYFSEPLVLIINTVVSAYIFILTIRVLLQYSGADSRNPISSFVIKVTKEPLKALKPIFPTVKDVNLSAITLMLVLQMLIGFVQWFGQAGLALWPIFIWSIAELTDSVITILIFSIFITIILSWINPGAQHPVVSLLYKITEPVLKPFQRWIPPMGGMDLSPMAALLGLQVLKMLLIPPLQALM